MPIKKEIGFAKGWKADENDRYGFCVVVKFKDTDTGKTLFQYAPCHDEAGWWVKFFEYLLSYDLMVKKLRGMNDEGLKQGSCGV